MSDDPAAPPPAADPDPGRTPGPAEARPRGGGRGRLRRRLLWGAGGVLAVLVLLPLLLVAGLLAWVNTEGGRAWIVGQVAEATSGSTAQVTVGGLSAGLPGAITVQDVRIADEDGTWLTLAEAQLRWDPWRLLSGVLRVDSLTARQIDIARLPGGDEAPQETTPFDPNTLLPDLPVAVSIGEVDLQDVAIAEPVAGMAALLDLRAQASVTPQAGAELSLDIRRKDGVGGRVTGRADITPSAGADRIDLELEVNEPAGGLIAAMAEWPATAPVRLRITGGGTLAEVTGEIAARVGEIARIDGRFSAAYAAAGEATDLQIDLQGDVAALLPEPARPLAGGSQQLKLDARSEASGKVTVRQLVLTTPALSLSGEAAMDPLAGPVSAALSVDRLDAAALQAFLPGLELQEPRLRLDLGGTMSEPTLDLAVEARQVAQDGMALRGLSLTARARPVAPLGDAGLPKIDIAVKGGADSVGLPDPSAQALLDRGLQLDLSGRADPEAEALTLDNLTVTLPDLTLTASGKGGATGPAALRASLDAPDLAVLGSAFGVPLKGGLQADITASGSDLAAADPGAWQASLSAQLRGFGYDDLPLQPLLGETATVQLDARGEGAERVAVSNLSLKGVAIAASGGAEAQLAAERLDADLQLTLSDLSALSALAGVELSGMAALQLDLAGNLTAPAMDAELQLQDAVLAGTPVVGKLTAKAPSLGLPLDMDLALDGRAMELPVRLQTGLAMTADGGTLKVENLRGALAEAALSGNLAVDLDSSLAQGRLDLDIAELKGLTGRFGAPLSGGLKGGVTLAAKPAGQGVTADVIASGLAMPDAGLEVRSARLQADLVLAAAGPRGKVDLELTEVEQAEAVLDKVALRAEGDLAAQMRASLEGAGDLNVGGRKKPLSFAAQAALKGLPPALTADLSGIRLALGGKAIRQQGSAALAMRGEEIALKGLRLDVDGGGSLAVDAASAPAAIDAKVVVAKLPLALAGLVVEDLPLTGTADMTADLQLRPGRPQGNVVLEVADLKPVQEEFQSLPPSTVTARAQLGDRRLALRAEWQALGADPGRLDIALPLRSPAGALFPEPDETGPLDGRLSWSGDLAQLGVFVPVDSEIGGRFEADLTIGGTLARPRVPGSIRIQDGVYRNYTTGTIVTGLQARVDGGEDGRLEIRAEGGDSAGGRINVTGHIDLEGDPLPTFEVRLATQRFVAARLDLATAVISADLTASGTPLRNAVEGQVTVESLDIQIDGGLPASATVIPVTVVPRPGAPPLNPQEPREAAKPSRTRLDIAVTIPPRMTVGGRGLESTWSGNLQVAGTTNNPRITGQITAVRGNFNLVGRQFNLTKGVIGFSGGTPPNPDIDIVMTYEGETATANIVISGTASDPRLNLTSNPSMPESDIVSAVLFNRRTGQLSPAEALEVATSLAALTGRGSPGAGITGQVRQALGLDVLSVGSSADGKPALNAGRYITDDVYVGVRQGLESNSGSVAVQVDLTDNIQVETDVGVDSNSSVGINWKYDY